MSLIMLSLVLQSTTLPARPNSLSQPRGTDFMADSGLVALPAVHRVPLQFLVTPPACCICGVRYARECAGVVCDSGRCWWPLPYCSRFHYGVGVLWLNSCQRVPVTPAGPNDISRIQRFAAPGAVPCLGCRCVRPLEALVAALR